MLIIRLAIRPSRVAEIKAFHRGRTGLVQLLANLVYILDLKSKTSADWRSNSRELLIRDSVLERCRQIASSTSLEYREGFAGLRKENRLDAA